ncbi:MAG: factor-independent urate hydroxylase [Lacipirellulaceae bacterium]
MSYSLSHNAYGKHAVRVSKIKRPRQGAPKDERHEFIEASIDVTLEGAFAEAYTEADNSSVVATDTVKNTVYAVAKDDPFRTIESFGCALVRHFVKQYDHVTGVTATLREQKWARLADSPYGFTGSDRETPTAVVRLLRGAEPTVTAGLSGLVVAKTTESGFANFHADEYRILPDTDDRVLATEVAGTWEYAPLPADFAAAREQIRQGLLAAFLDHYSVSVQQTIWRMGQAALDRCPAAQSITLSLPNKHHILANLKALGRENANEVFVSTSEPHGWITGTITR